MAGIKMMVTPRGVMVIARLLVRSTAITLSSADDDSK